MRIITIAGCIQTPDDLSHEDYTGTVSFFHSGDLGDIIYALKAISLAKGGNLIVGPKIDQKHLKGRLPIDTGLFNFIRSLLEQQPYLKSVSYCARPCSGTAFDLNGFRSDFNQRRNCGDKTLSLARGHALFMGLNSWSEDPWLTIATDPKPDHPRLIFSRSPRYHDANFPWKEIVLRHASEAVFVGFQAEHQRFCEAFGAVKYMAVQDAAQLAVAISLAQWFVGNQSFPCAVALGLGTNVYQETFRAAPDCLFRRTNFHNQFMSDLDVLK